MNVDIIARNVGLKDSSLVGKAKELERLASLRVTGGLGQGEVCKAAICLELACTAVGVVERPPRDVFLRHSCASKKVYETTYQLLARALQVQPRVTLPDLALAFDATHIIEPVRQLQLLYQSRFKEELQEQAAARAASGATAGPRPADPDFSRPVFLGAAFFLVAKLRKVKVEVRKLQQKLQISTPDFNATLASMQQLCGDALEAAAAAFGKSTKAKKAAGKDPEAGADGDAGAEGAGEEALKKKKRSRAAGTSQPKRGKARKGKASSEDDEEEEDAAGSAGSGEEEEVEEEEVYVPVKRAGQCNAEGSEEEGEEEEGAKHGKAGKAGRKAGKRRRV